MTPFGEVTFTSVVNADGNQPPCGTGSQWVNRIVRTIHTTEGTLVLHEAGLQCPQPGVGPRVQAVWTVDGADSTGIFAGAQGCGYDTAYPARDTAAAPGHDHPRAMNNQRSTIAANPRERPTCGAGTQFSVPGGRRPSTTTGSDQRD
jgi:hypothetical protein